MFDIRLSHRFIYDLWLFSTLSNFKIVRAGGKCEIMIGVYFSGTGNSKYVVDQFLIRKSPNDYTMHSIEENDVTEYIKQANEIVIGYPIYYSALPKIFNDFLDENIELFRDKKVFIISTMGLFSGDGPGLAQRKLKKVNAVITGGLQLKMPDNICDEKVLKNAKHLNKIVIQKAIKSINNTVCKINEGETVRQGLSPLSFLAGFLGQRLYFGHKVKSYSDKIKIDKSLCVKCGKCVSACPMQNLELSDCVHSSNKCTLCYRCLNLCPTKAITLLGKKVVQQHCIDDLIE